MNINNINRASIEKIGLDKTEGSSAEMTKTLTKTIESLDKTINSLEKQLQGFGSLNINTRYELYKTNALKNFAKGRIEDLLNELELKNISNEISEAPHKSFAEGFHQRLGLLASGRMRFKICAFNCFNPTLATKNIEMLKDLIKEVDERTKEDKWGYAKFTEKVIIGYTGFNKPIYKDVTTWKK